MRISRGSLSYTPENIDNRVWVITDPLYTELTDPLNLMLGLTGSLDLTHGLN
jgi:hypothetical protein